YRRGDTSKLDQLAFLPLQDLQVVDLDTAKPLTVESRAVRLTLPITNDKQSAHLKVTGTLKDPAYKVVNGDLVFERTLHGLRNTVLLPAGWEVSAVSQSGTIGSYEGRAFVALINLNAENNYKVAIRARKGGAAAPATRAASAGGAASTVAL